VVKAAVFAVPGDLATPTGGYGYDRRMIAELGALGWRVDVVNLGDGFPQPASDIRAAAAGKLAALSNEQPIVIDGLAFGVLPQAAEILKASHALVALVHHPLALESGLSAPESAVLRASERSALACARHVIATSAATARLLVSQYDVAPAQLSVVAPGTDRAAARPPPAACGAGPGRGRADAVALLAVGSLVPRKGYDVLVAALARLVHLPWRLVIAGDDTRSPATARELATAIARLGLTDRIALRSALGAAELEELYASSDLFVLPSRFEGYGMAYAEAIAHGLPVVGTTAGAIPETVPPAAGILVEPDDITALAAALHRLIESADARARLAAGARAARFPSWPEQAVLFARVLEGVR
jgi:glycosyltransferase involved in cell wall biosynthesis